MAKAGPYDADCLKRVPLSCVQGLWSGLRTYGTPDSRSSPLQLQPAQAALPHDKVRGIQSPVRTPHKAASLAVKHSVFCRPCLYKDAPVLLAVYGPLTWPIFCVALD